MIAHLLALALVTPTPQEPTAIPHVGPTGPMVRVATGLVFTEGPAADADGNLYFSDVRGNTVYRLGADGELSKFLEDSQGCNGLMIDAEGRLVACQGGAKRIIAIDVESKEMTVLADKFEGQPFDRPNDLVIDRKGGVYFTDPGAGAVYYVDADGAVSRVAAELPRPNGVLLSPDGTRLYVLPSGSAEVLSYPVEGPGKVGAKTVLCQLDQAPGQQARGGDGLTVDENGVLYLTQPALSALQVVAPNGDDAGLHQGPRGAVELRLRRAGPEDALHHGADLRLRRADGGDRPPLRRSGGRCSRERGPDGPLRPDGRDDRRHGRRHPGGRAVVPSRCWKRCLARIDEREAEVRAWVLVDRDGARAEAERLDADARREGVGRAAPRASRSA